MPFPDEQIATPLEFVTALQVTEYDEVIFTVMVTFTPATGAFASVFITVVVKVNLCAFCAAVNELVCVVMAMCAFVTVNGPLA